MLGEIIKQLFIADVHIKLGQKNVPVDWQYNRYMMLAEELRKVCVKENIQTVIIGGDLLDVAKPSVPEVGLMFDFLKALDHKDIVVIPGNHELLNKTKDCYEPIDELLKVVNTRVIREFENYNGVDFIPYNIIKKFKASMATSTGAVTHVRAAIPPHVEPEIDLSVFEPYTTVWAGDLHSYKNSQLNLLYPGSPLSTSFHRRVPSGGNGYFIIDNLEHTEWRELFLPQLVRRTVTTKAEIVPTEFHHTIYNIEGTIEELGQIDSSTELLDKKINTFVVEESTLNLQDKSISEELVEYLENIKGIKGQALQRIMGRYNDHVSN